MEGVRILSKVGCVWLDNAGLHIQSSSSWQNIIFIFVNFGDGNWRPALSNHTQPPLKKNIIITSQVATNSLLCQNCN